METSGDVTMFKHVTRRIDPQKLRSGEQVLIVVWFDGEPELWAADDSPRLAMRELHSYYKRDWAGTKRVLPVMCYEHGIYDSIECI